MSHFPLAVITKDPHDVDKLLEPFNECVDSDSPYAKWDWYDVGGRWRNLLRLKTSPGVRVDQAKIGNVDFSPDEQRRKRALREWEVAVEGANPNEGEKLFPWKPEYYTKKYGDKENYAKIQSELMIFAYLLPDGTWHEQGEMGWWGFDSATKESISAYGDDFKRDVVGADPDLYITIVDCHI